MIYFLSLIIWLAAINIAAYFFMWRDKIRAMRNEWRIPENVFSSKPFRWFYGNAFGHETFFVIKRCILVLNLLLLLVHFFGLSFFHGYIFLLFFNM